MGLLSGNSLGVPFSGSVVMGDLRVVAQRLTGPTAGHESSPQVDTDTGGTDPGDREGHLQEEGSQVAARLTDVLRGLLPHGDQTPVPVLLPELGLSGFLDVVLLAAHHLDVLTEVAAHLARVGGDRQDHQAVTPVLGVRRRDPRNISVARMRTGILQHSVVEVGDVLTRHRQDGQVNLLAELQILELVAQRCAVKHAGLVLDLDRGPVGGHHLLLRWPEPYDQRREDQGQAQDHDGGEGHY